MRGLRRVGAVGAAAKAPRFEQPTAGRRSGQTPYALPAAMMAIAMASLFAISYSLALGRPTAHKIPVGIVGAASSERRLVSALETATGKGLRLVRYQSLGGAEQAIRDQQIYGTLEVGAGRPRLLIASAAGASVAHVLEQAANRAAVLVGIPLAVFDLHPLPSGDPQGLMTFYVTLAATILGFVTMFQLRANVPGLSLRGWLIAVATLAVVGGLALALVVDPLIGALRGPFAELWGLLAAQIAVAALFNCAMLTLIGRWAMIPTWGLFVAVGNAASGGAVAPPLLPPFYGFVGRFLPSGATVEAIRNAAYFRSDQPLEPLALIHRWVGLCCPVGIQE